MTATTTDHQTQARSGILAGVGAYLIWGLSPVYFKQLAHVPPIIVLSHRVVWSVVFIGLLISAQGAWRELRSAVRSQRTLAILTLSTVLIACNWYLFIWTITNGRIVQAALGYFITPLMTVLLGIVFLKERLRPWQIVSFVLAAIGVMTFAIGVHELPTVALLLAITFSLYGLLRKIVGVGPLLGLAIETGFLFPIALALMLSPLGAERTRAAPSAIPTWFLLAIAGVVTAVPLLLFATAARRLRLATLGFLQYLGPICQLIVAVFLYGEPFTQVHLVSFAMIWLALAIFSADSWRAMRPTEEAAVMVE